MANKRIIELQERTQLDMNDYLIVDSSTSTRKLSMSTLLNYMTMTQMIFVTELPTEDISTSTIYLVPHSGSNTQWDEYIYRENEWVLIGTSTIDLSAIYQTKTDNNLETTSKQIVEAINEVNNDLNKFALDYAAQQAISGGSLHGFIAPADGVVFANMLVSGTVDAWMNIVNINVTPHANYHVYRFRYQGAAVASNSMPVMVPIRKGWAVTYDQVANIGDDASLFVPFVN